MMKPGSTNPYPSTTRASWLHGFIGIKFMGFLDLPVGFLGTPFGERSKTGEREVLARYHSAGAREG